MASSPGCVLAASNSGRPATAAFKFASTLASTGGGGASIFRLPATITLGAPSCLMVRATASFWASTTLKRENSGRPTRAFLRQRFMLRGDMRALISASGMARSAVASTRFGQMSDSVKIDRFGRQ